MTPHMQLAELRGARANLLVLKQRRSGALGEAGAWSHDEWLAVMQVIDLGYENLAEKLIARNDELEATLRIISEYPHARANENSAHGLRSIARAALARSAP